MFEKIAVIMYSISGGGGLVWLHCYTLSLQCLQMLNWDIKRSYMCAERDIALDMYFGELLNRIFCYGFERVSYIY